MTSTTFIGVTVSVAHVECISLVNVGCLLPYQNHQWKCPNANTEEEEECNSGQGISVLTYQPRDPGSVPRMLRVLLFFRWELAESDVNSLLIYSLLVLSVVSC
jgi:hypothetical protein